MSLKKTEKLERARQITEYKYSHEGRLWEALSAPGASDAQSEGNNRLASIGGPAMQMIMKLDAYHAGESTGSASDRVTRHASQAALTRVFAASGLADCLNKNPSQFGSEVPPKTAMAVVQALVGLVAFEEDGRTEAIRGVMRQLGIGQ